MKLYLVPNQQMFPKERNEQREGELFKGVHILQAFCYCDTFTEKVILPNCKSFLLDSGAFTFMNSAKGKPINWEQYINRYIDFIVRNDIDFFFELDIDSIVGLEQVERIRRKIEQRTGKQPIPVFHRERGKDYFVDMCKNYPYVAIGGMTAGVEREAYKRTLPWFINTAHDHGAKIHGLGFTDMKGLKKYRFDSVDSSTWAAGNRFGKVYVFDGETIQTYSRKEGTKIADHQKLSLHNFKEWVKFQRYAEKNL